MFCRRRCSLAFIIWLSPAAGRISKMLLQSRMLRHELYSMTHIPRLKDENVAASCASSVMPSCLPLSKYPKQMYFMVLLLRREAAAQPYAGSFIL